MASFRPLQLTLVIENVQELEKSEDVLKSKPAQVRGLQWTLCANTSGPESARKLTAFILCEVAKNGTSWDGSCAASYDISLMPNEDTGEIRTFGEKKRGSARQAPSTTWDTYPTHTTILASEKELGGEKSSTDDVSFRVGEQLVHANKGYLSVVSPVFERMFNGEFREKDADVVSLEDVEPKDFLEFIQVVYPSRKKVDRYNVFRLMVLAERFDVGFLLEDCMEFIRTEQNSVPAIEKLCFAEQWEFTIMKDEVIASLSADQIKCIRKDKGFKKLSVETITDLMDRYMSLKA